jgi:hypothetical protein
MKRTPLKKISNRRKEKLENDKVETRTMYNFFLSIWDSLREENKKCFETGAKIYEPRSYNFHHILPKETYPEYKFSEWNIALVSWHTHDQIHKDIDLTPKVKAKYEELLEKHKNDELTP